MIYNSRLNTSQELTESMWGVTLIKNKEHAMLAVEGVNEQGQFLKCIHLTGKYTDGIEATIKEDDTQYFYGSKGKVKIYDIGEAKPLKYDGKSQTWIKTKESVQALIDSAMCEVQAYNDGSSTNPTPFNLLGNKSLFVKKEKVFEINNTELIALRQNDPKKFMDIYKISKHPEYFSPDSKHNKVIHNEFISIFNEMSNELVSYFVDLMRTHVKEVTVSPNNCFTWARDKLKIIEVNIPERETDKLVAKTSWYMDDLGGYIPERETDKLVAKTSWYMDDLGGYMDDLLNNKSAPVRYPQFGESSEKEAAASPAYEAAPHIPPAVVEAAPGSGKQNGAAWFTAMTEAIGTNVAKAGAALAEGSALTANAVFHKYYVNFEPQQNNPLAPAVGQFVSTDLRVSNHVTETLAWKVNLILSAEQSIELSANFAGGEVFRNVLDVITRRMEKKPQLCTHILLSPDLLEPADLTKLEMIKKQFPNKFHYLITDRIYKPFCSEENHVKLLVVDGKYFVTGGTGIHEKMCRETAPLDQENDKSPPGSNLIDRAFRDTDVIGRGDVSKTMRNQFFNLYRIWEHRMTGTSESRYFDISNPGLAASMAFDKEENLIKAVQLKFIVAGPEHHENPIVEEYSRLISSALREVKIATLIFNPAANIKKSLKNRKLAGLKIKGYFNGTDGLARAHYIYALPNRLNYDLVTHAYEYGVPDQLYHKKAMTVDGHFAVIGTANLGVKSARCDYEAIVVVDDERVADAVNQGLKADAGASKKLTGEQLQQVYKTNLVLGHTANFLLGPYFG